MSIAKTLGESLETCKHVSLATDSLGHPVLFRFEVRSLAVVRSALFNSLWKNLKQAAIENVETTKVLKIVTEVFEIIQIFA